MHGRAQYGTTGSRCMCIYMHLCVRVFVCVCVCVCHRYRAAMDQATGTTVSARSTATRYVHHMNRLYVRT